MTTLEAFAIAAVLCAVTLGIGYVLGWAAPREDEPVSRETRAQLVREIEGGQR